MCTALILEPSCQEALTEEVQDAVPGQAELIGVFLLKAAASPT